MPESSRTPAHGRRRLMSWRSPRRGTPTSAVFQNFLMEEGSKETKVEYVLTDPTTGKPPGTGAVQKYWKRGPPLIASGPVVSLLPDPALRDGFSVACSLLSGSMHRGGFVGVLGLRIVVQDVAASLGLAVAAAAVFGRCGVTDVSCCGSDNLNLVGSSMFAFSSLAGTLLTSRTSSSAWKGARSKSCASREKPKAPVRKRHHLCHRLSMIRPRASRSSSHRDERWEGCRV